MSISALGQHANSAGVSGLSVLEAAADPALSTPRIDTRMERINTTLAATAAS